MKAIRNQQRNYSVNLKKCLASLIFLTFFVLPSFHAKDDTKALLLDKFGKNLDKKGVQSIRKIALEQAGKSIPALIEVMKSSKYPDQGRWVATFLVGRIMGKKSAPFLSKFIKHPNWVLRVASLKTLLALKQAQYGEDFANALKDNSFIVRKQALDNITKLALDKYAPNVWALLHDKRNYYVDGNKGTNLIKEAILSVGKLKFEKAKVPLLEMAQKNKYNDVFDAINHSLEKILNKKAPSGGIETKRNFWKKISLIEKNF